MAGPRDGNGMKKSAAVLLVVGLVLAGCNSGKDQTPQTRSIQAGDCVAREASDTGDKAPDLKSVVDCSKPHIYEINAVIELPATALTGSTVKAKLANRTDLAAPSVKGEDSAERLSYLKFSEEACENAMRKATGFDALAIGGKASSVARIMPPLRGAEAVWRNLSPKADWATGKRQLVCSSRFSQARKSSESVGPGPVSSADGNPVMSTLLSTDFPVERRQCVAFDKDDKRSLAACGEQHYGEILFSFDAKAVIGSDFVNAVNRESPSDEQYAALDRACGNAIGQFIDAAYDKSQLGARAELGEQGWGTKDNDYYPVQCLVVAHEFKTMDLPAGSLIDKDGTGIVLIDIS